MDGIWSEFLEHFRKFKVANKGLLAGTDGHAEYSARRIHFRFVRAIYILPI